MKNITIEIISKGRKYFKCKMNGYDAKLVIDDKSENLESVVHELICEDISIRTKYGTDLIFKVLNENKIDEKPIVFKHDRYNEDLVRECRCLAGKWDPQEKIWIFNKMVEKEVEELDYIYNSENVIVTLTAKSNCVGDAEPINFCGYKICSATGRDSGAKLADGVAILSGSIGSGGSQKNWITKIDEGSILKIEVPINKLEHDTEWENKKGVFLFSVEEN